MRKRNTTSLPSGTTALKRRERQTAAAERLRFVFGLLRRCAGWRSVLICNAVLSLVCAAADFRVMGRVFDPQGQPVARATVQLIPQPAGLKRQTTTADDGQFQFSVAPPGEYHIRVEAPGFAPIETSFRLGPGTARLDLHLEKLALRSDSVTVTADAGETTLATPDPAEQVFLRDELLAANPGRPGAPVEIPGIPVETASGGIKAPQYFAPGVAGDHGEPIAQYLMVGSYRLLNNLSANAHGNGYADPNILIPQVIESVQVDGGAFNVLEGNHALNLAAAYGLRSQLAPFLTLTGDTRNADLVGGFSPGGPQTRSWVALEASYGNGFLDRPEHRQQYKINASRAYQIGAHELTMVGLGYYGNSYVPGLVPIGIGGLHDTIDPRQKDQTHTVALAANDVWKLSSTQVLQLSGFFRTYNLALYSNFGDGLIRQSEFRTVTDANTTYTHRRNRHLALLAGVDYLRDAPRRLDLDHYLSGDPSYYGPFQKVAANNVTIGDLAPYLALSGAVVGPFRYYLGFRRDEILFDNTDLLNAAHSFERWTGVNSPKATLSYVPGQKVWAPSIALSFGEAFFTNDPRIGTGAGPGTPVERAHSYELVLDKRIGNTDLRLLLGHVTTGATFAKLDPDTGLQEDQGPGRLRFLTALARHRFRFGLLQASFSKADARNALTGEPTPEAPRTILGALASFDRLPFRLQARTGFDYVGQKPLGDGFVSVAVKEFRLAIMRSLWDRRMDLGLNGMIASGYTGQTTEFLSLTPGTPPIETVVGVRLPSYVGLNVTYHFGIANRP
jgi:hypothetical protein